MAAVMRHLRPIAKTFFGKVTPSSTLRFYADAPSAPAKDMAFTFASANQVFYDQADVKQIDVPSFSGSFGILPKHVPTLAVLSPGVVTVFEADGNTKKIFVSSGVVCVNEDSTVQILAEEAHPVEDIDASAAKESLQKAQSDLSSASGEQKEEAAIAVEVAEAIVRAVS